VPRNPEPRAHVEMSEPSHYRGVEHLAIAPAAAGGPEIRLRATR